MGAKTWMLVYSEGAVPEILKSQPTLDRDATTSLARTLFPSDKLKPLSDDTLMFACPPEDELALACFPGLSIVAATEFGGDYPSKLPRSFLVAGPGRSTYLHAMHSVVDWFAYAIWKDHRLQRSLSLSPDSGVLEDIGPRLAFEEPYWAGEHSASDADEDDDNAVPFHPLELGEAALLALFGYQLEGEGNPSVDPSRVPLMRFKRSRSWWKRW